MANKRGSKDELRRKLKQVQGFQPEQKRSLLFVDGIISSPRY
ncbi:hypothetical protein [Dendronalium phyllosphericum]|nr:hypothetical protein [Dendronalium phyllosphericum]